MHHQPALPTDLPHQLPVDCEDRGAECTPSGHLQATVPAQPPRTPRPLSGASRVPSPAPSPSSLRRGAQLQPEPAPVAGVGFRGRRGPCRDRGLQSPAGHASAGEGKGRWRKGLPGRGHATCNSKKHSTRGRAGGSPGTCNPGSQEQSGRHPLTSQPHEPLTGHRPDPRPSKSVNE